MVERGHPRYAENDRQAAALRNLVAYYETGDPLEKWSLYNINWVQDTEGDVDYTQRLRGGLQRPTWGTPAATETIVEIKDFDAGARMATLLNSAQWSEDHMPFMPEHKKSEVVGITYNVVNVAGEAGRCLAEHPHRGEPALTATGSARCTGPSPCRRATPVNAYDKAVQLAVACSRSFGARRRRGFRCAPRRTSELAGKLHTRQGDEVNWARLGAILRAPV